MANKGGWFLKSKSTGATGLGRLKKTNVAIAAAAVGTGAWAVLDPDADDKINDATGNLFSFIGNIFSGAFGGLLKAFMISLVPCCSISCCLLIAYLFIPSFSSIMPSMSPRQ